MLLMPTGFAIAVIGLVVCRKYLTRSRRQENGESALMQLQVQLSNPLPFDLDDVKLSEYKLLDARWHEWATVRAMGLRVAALIFDRLIGETKNEN